ncbi:DNA-3-methyladenine glycosylase I [Cellulosilyticum ruminicola]|uniref:DNA-3-methyladenine glycosylase I n=1 Tax=Cellulosilyticum ruminicola TaxID=425254 RepID=UPI0006D19B01|nr:DNA-3-methyladenine glycosylase I [Cellulosilyticum ruminicola]
MERCDWCKDNDLNQQYHDEEWGNPLHDDQKHFEYISLEVMQCGLSWSLMLKKREIFRECFANFDYKKIAQYTEEDVERIMNVEGMIKSRRKIEAIISNAKAFLKIIEEFTSFDQYIWAFTDYQTYIYPKHHNGQWEASNALSDKISKDLKKRGFKYLGSITVFSHLQACGIINDHAPKCFRYKELVQLGNIKYIESFY